MESAAPDPAAPESEVSTSDAPASTPQKLPVDNPEKPIEDDEISTQSPPDFITTHVLDQVAGTPAAGLSATLTLISQKSQPSYTATTNPITGRISNWKPSTPTTAPMDQVLPILAVIKSQSPPGWKSVWSLRFYTGVYWEAQRRRAKAVSTAAGSGSGAPSKGEEVHREDGDYEDGSATFYPEVEIKFYVDPEDPRMHWHVPVLLGPHGYTTYRGS